jgi:hypothetical protein
VAYDTGYTCPLARQWHCSCLVLPLPRPLVLTFTHQRHQHRTPLSPR